MENSIKEIIKQHLYYNYILPNDIISIIDLIRWESTSTLNESNILDHKIEDYCEDHILANFFLMVDLVIINYMKKEYPNVSYTDYLYHYYVHEKMPIITSMYYQNQEKSFHEIFKIYLNFLNIKNSKVEDIMNLIKWNNEYSIITVWNEIIKDYPYNTFKLNIAVVNDAALDWIKENKPNDDPYIDFRYYLLK